MIKISFNNYSSTGYRWFYSDNHYENCVLTESFTMTPKQNGNRIGGNFGKEVFVFDIKEYKLKFFLQRPWESVPVEEREFIIKNKKVINKPDNASRKVIKT